MVSVMMMIAAVNMVGVDKLRNIVEMDANQIMVFVKQKEEKKKKKEMMILNQVKDMNLAELNRLAETILPMVHTDLSKGEITSILMSAPKVLGKTAEQMAVPDHNDQHCDFQYESDRLQNFLYG